MCSYASLRREIALVCKPALCANACLPTNGCAGDGALERGHGFAALVIKRDGTREEFDREKLMRGIRIACAKRPVSAAEIERLVGEIESSLQQMSRSEVSSRVIGDMVITGLKNLDQLAYIRYAIVYLHLNDLYAIRKEIDRLLEG